MEDKNKRGKIQTRYLLAKKRKLSTTSLQPNHHPTRGLSHIPRVTSRQETHLEKPHLNIEEAAGPQDQRLDYRETLSAVLHNKLLIYKAILKPTWSYGIEISGCASPSNVTVIQRYQSKLLRLITNAPRYVTNQTLHHDLLIRHVRNVFRERAQVHRKNLTTHPNPLMGQLINQPQNRRQKRRWTFDEAN